MGKEKTSRIIPVLLLSAAGFAGNWFNLPLFFNLDFVFGSIFVMIAVGLYGTLPGILTAAVAASCTYFLWNNPWSIIIFTCEALFVGYTLEHKSKNMVLLDTFFWLLIGMPMGWVFFSSIMGVTHQGALLLMLKQAINGIFNTLLATFLLAFINYYKFRGKPNHTPTISFRHAIGNILTAAILFPALFFMISNIRDEMDHQESQMKRRVLNVSNASREMLKNWLDEHREVLQVVSYFEKEPDVTSQEKIQNDIEFIRKTTTDFLHVGVLNSRGVAVARSPRTDGKGKSGIGTDFSETQAYKELRRTLQPVVSDVTIGRNHSTPYIFMAVPTIDSGELKGACVGDLDLAEFTVKLKSIIRQRPVEITVFDSKKNIIVSTGGEWKIMDTFQRPGNAEIRTFDNGIYQWVPKPEQNVSTLTRWGKALFAKETTPGDKAPWTIVVEVPMSPYIGKVQTTAINNLTAMMFLVLMAVFFSHYLSRGLVASLGRLQNITSDIPVKLTRQDNIMWPESSITEISGLINNFKLTTEVLRQNFSELRTINETLEQRVQERTGELSREIAERKQAGNELVKSEARLKEAQKIAHIGNWEWDIINNALWWSDEAFRIFNLLPGQEISVEIFSNKLFHEDRKRVLESINNAVSKGAPLQLDYRIEMPAGEPRYIHEESRTICDEHNRAVRRVGTVQDVTDLKIVEDALRESEERYRLLVDNIPLGITLVDSDYRVIMANPLYEKWFRKARSEFEGKHCHKEFEKRDLPCPHCPGTVSMATGKPAEAYTEGVRDDGSRFSVHIRTAPFFGADAVPKGFIEVVEDITGLKHAEEEQRRLEEQLRHSQKMEAVGLLAGGVAHDFNNILTAIIGYAHVTMIKMTDGDPLKNNIELILQSSQRAASLIQSLLAFSRKQIINPGPADLNEIVGHLDKLLRRVIGEDIELKTALHRTPLTIMADRGQIEQVVMNLATNARDAMPAGGSLTIKTEAVQLDEKFIREYGFGKPGEYALLSIADTGTGIDEKTRGRIFEPFFTTKEVGRGTGLGLSMVYGAVQQNKGHINIDSESGKGTTVRIYLPLMATAVKEDRQTEDAVIKRGTETILIAEDDQSIRKLMNSILKEFGYTPLLAEDGIEAIEIYNKNKEDIHLLILDVIMPRKDGKAVYEEIRKSKPGIKALFISGYTADILDRKVLLEDGINLMTKPIMPEELLKKVRDILDE
ncbi:MAG: response regulator [Nitrospirae bacterium]|nr:response regulator [Nitrospirota bacterium]